MILDGAISVNPATGKASHIPDRPQEPSTRERLADAKRGCACYRNSFPFSPLRILQSASAMLAYIK